MPSTTPIGAKDRLTKANELARKAMQFAATGVNIKEPVKRFIIELEARKDIPPKLLYSVFFLVAPWDQQARALAWAHTFLCMCIAQACRRSHRRARRCECSLASSAVQPEAPEKRQLEVPIRVQIATMIAGLLAARCADADETVRRASLQQLTSLRIPSLVDTMLQPIEKALDDPSPAVRAAAVLAVLKVATLADTDLNLDRYWAKVDEMLRADEAAEVVHACVALKLQREDEATMAKDKALVEDLMIRLGVRCSCVLEYLTCRSAMFRWRSVASVWLSRMARAIALAPRRNGGMCQRAVRSLTEPLSCSCCTCRTLSRTSRRPCSRSPRRARPLKRRPLPSVTPSPACRRCGLESELCDCQ
jgi:non-SMC mitotic condensation complex subunit 1